MESLKRYTFQIVALVVLVPLMFAGARTTKAELAKTAPELPHLNEQFQQAHALELSSESTLAGQDQRREILRAVKGAIPAKYMHRSYEIARAVITEANRHKMDPFFLLAVIKTESHFNIQARGAHGEIGLMQLLPDTAKWLAGQSGLTPGFNLEDPRTNIRLGAAYFGSLRKEFPGNSARYIGAYNMGSGNVYRLMQSDQVPVEYPERVLKNYHRFYKTAVERMAVLAARQLAFNKAHSKTVRAPKKLQTRSVLNRCGVNRCKPSAQPLMPDWTTT